MPAKDPVLLSSRRAPAQPAARAEFITTGGRWLLGAWCRLRDDVRWFNLPRIQTATATRHPFTGHDISEIGIPPEQARPVGA